MASRKDANPLDDKDLASLFADADRAARFPPILTADEAAALVRVSKHTIYCWSSQGRLKGCKARPGKHLRIHRDKFIQLVFSEEFNDR